MAAVQNGFCHISTIVHTPRAPPPPRNVSDLFYFVPGTCLNMKSGFHHHQIGMDNLWDAILKMTAIKISVYYISAYNSVSKIDRDKMLVCDIQMTHVYVDEESNDNTENPYDPWLTLNSKWLPSKPAEITLISQWAQY